MKLTESWVEDIPGNAAVEHFHDEVEEDDEVDEAQDGCGSLKEGSHQRQTAT